MRTDAQHIRRTARRRRGFTLLEAVLALMLTILLLSGVFTFFLTTLKARDEGSVVTREAMLARFLLQRMSEEIQHAVPLVGGDGIGFQGKKDRITIISTRVPESYAFGDFDLQTDDLPPMQSDLVRVEYRLVYDDEAKDPETGDFVCFGLLRMAQKRFDPNPRYQASTSDDEDGMPEEELGLDIPIPETELIAPEIKYIRFEYFDGAQWKDRWQVPYELPTTEGASAEGVAPEDADSPTLAEPGAMDYALPQAVRITIGRTPVARDEETMNFSGSEDGDELLEGEQYHEDRFTILVHLQQADPSLLSSRKHGVQNSPLDDASGLDGLGDLTGLGGS